MKHCNNHLITVEQHKRNTAKGKISVDIEMDCIWVILKKVGLTFFKILANRLEGLFFSLYLVYHLLCDVNDNFKDFPQMP